MSNRGYFSTERDREIEKAGGFWCHACLVSHLAAEQSPDPRYCQGCYDFLLKEAELLTGTKRPKWIPKPQKAGGKQYPVSGVGDRIMSTLSNQKSEVDIIHPPDVTRTPPKRGPKYKALPIDLIMQWASESMGSKAIAARLKGELGIIVSYKTIQRVLKGERKHLAIAWR